MPTVMPSSTASWLITIGPASNASVISLLSKRSPISRDQTRARGRRMVSGGRGKLFQPSLLRQTQSVCACERSEAIHREAKQKAGLLRCARNDDINGHTSQGNTHVCVLAARMRPRCARILRLSMGRAWGMPGADAPAASHANKKAYELVTTGKPDDPAFPHAMVLTV